MFPPISPKFRQGPWIWVSWLYALQIVINTQLGVVCDIVINNPLSILNKSWPCTAIYRIPQKSQPTGCVSSLRIVKAVTHVWSLVFRNWLGCEFSCHNVQAWWTICEITNDSSSDTEWIRCQVLWEILDQTFWRFIHAYVIVRPGSCGSLGRDAETRGEGIEPLGSVW